MEEEIKKMVIVYGNCHTAIVEAMLNSCEEFTKKYYIQPTKRIQDIKDPAYLHSEFYSQCDVFIHQSIRLGNRYGEEYASENIIARLKLGCRVISIPNVYHLPLCFFPQYHDAPELKNKKVNGGLTFFFRDLIIDSHLDNLCTLYKRVKKDYSSTTLFDNKSIGNSFNKFIDKVKKREQNWDIKVSQFILSNYQNHQLFYDPNHPTNYFLSYVTDELLGILLDEKPRWRQDLKIKENLQSLSIPYCKSVINALGLKWSRNTVRDGDCYSARIPFKMNIFWYTYQYCICLWMADDISKGTRVLSKILWYNNNLLFFAFRCTRKVKKNIKS